VDKSINNVHRWKKELIPLRNLMEDNDEEAGKTLNCWLATNIYPENKDNIEIILNEYSTILSETILGYYSLQDVL
jgi:hypothetical protein